MSDTFEMLADATVSAEDAERVSLAVLTRFREMGLIAGDAKEECVLGGSGYRPGPAVSHSYQLEPQESEFWTLVTCGVEPHIGRGFNEWALGPVFEGMTCPACSSTTEDFGGEELWSAISEWLSQSGSGLVQCPKCATRLPITELQCDPPLGFGNLSFRFWNWPPLDSSAWKINIPAIIGEATGHNIIHTWGRI